MPNKNQSFALICVEKYGKNVLWVGIVLFIFQLNTIGNGGIVEFACL